MKTAEYRKSTAEALGLESMIFKESDYTDCDPYRLWQPDKDANQRDMVWDLIADRDGYDYLFNEVYRHIDGKNPNLFTATQKAWEQFNNQ